MPGGKETLNSLFTTRLQVGTDGTDSVQQILSGSATITGGAGISACAARGSGIMACVIGEITVAGLNPCDMLFVNVWGTTACLVYNGEALAGDGQASVVMRYTGSDASMDSGWGGTARYIAFQIT